MVDKLTAGASSAIANYVIGMCATAFYVNISDKTVQVLQDAMMNDAELGRMVYSFDEAVGFYVQNYVHEEDRELVAKNLSLEYARKALKDRDSYTFNFRENENGNGEMFRGIVLRGEDENHFVILYLNISEEFKKEIANVERNNFHQNLINRMASDEGLFIIDCKKNIRKTVHDRCDGRANYSDTEPYTSSIANYVNNCVFPEDREIMRKVTSPEYMLDRVQKDGEYVVEYRDISSSVKHYFEMRIVKFSDTEVLQSFKQNDIGFANKLMFEKLESEYFAIFAVDLDDGLVQFIKGDPQFAFGKIGEVAAYEPVIQFIADLYEGETKDFFLRIKDVNYLKERFRNENKATYTYKTVVSEQEKWGNATGIVGSRHEDGTPAMFILAFSLIDSFSAEREEQQKKIQQAYKAAELANKSKTNFLFSMSHDIRTPMNAITGFTVMAKKYADNKDRLFEYLDKIDLSSKELLVLINQILEMSRIESGRIEFNETAVNIRDKFTSKIAVLSGQAKSKGLTFNYSIDEIEHEYVFADEARMSSITLNVAGNAIKYTPEGGTVEFHIKEIPPRKQDYATYVLTISDNGIGMSEEFLKVLFEPFSRESNSTVSKIQGTGLGMSIVKSLVDLMGGTIDVTSSPGKGTKFEITFDLKIDKDKNASKPNVPNITDFSFNGRRVLLVEDNEMNREIAKDLLEDYGLIIEEACDGDIAVEMYQNALKNDRLHYYDFILMDVQMPKMNGYEATKLIKKTAKEYNVHIPVIAMTANAFEEDRRNAFSAGMDEHLSKPLDIQKLLETLVKFL